MSRVAEMVSENIKPIIEGLGYELAEVTYKKRSDGMHLTVTIASDAGVGIDDCEKVHLAIDKVLDDLDPTKGESYRLNVSSLGLDRQFKTTRDYERALGREIVIKLYTAVSGSKEFVGVLKSVTGLDVCLETENGVMTFERSHIAGSQQYIKV